MSDSETARREVEEFQKKIGALREEIGRIIVGNREVIDGVLSSDVHELLQDALRILHARIDEATNAA